MLSTSQLYFTLVVPSGAKPAKGWPVAIWGQGSGNSKDFTLPLVAGIMAKHGIATIAINGVGNGWGPAGTLSIQKNDLSIVEVPEGGRGVDQDGDGFIGAIGDGSVYVEQREDSLLTSCEDEKLIRDYFALDHPLAEICASFPNDPAMNAAKEFCRGLRIIRQPKWECLATFICSSMKQVAHIRQISRNLRERFGGPPLK